MNVIELKDAQTGAHMMDVQVKEFQELTVADYARIVDGAFVGEEGDKMIERAFSIPLSYVHRIGRKQAEDLIDWYTSWIGQSQAQWETHGRIAEQLKANENWTIGDAIAHLKEEGAFVTGFDLTIDGEVVRVLMPKSADIETTYGQWLSVKKKMNDHQKKEGEPNSRLWAPLLSRLCLMQGEVYDPKVMLQREAAFQQVRAVDAIDALAFFFSRSIVFRSDFEAVWKNYRRWPVPFNVPERMLLTSSAERTSN